MKTIERIKINLRSAQMGERMIWNPDHIAALIEYYEAAEGFLEWGAAKTKEKYERLDKARKALQKDD